MGLSDSLLITEVIEPNKNVRADQDAVWGQGIMHYKGPRIPPPGEGALLGVVFGVRNAHDLIARTVDILNRPLGAGAMRLLAASLHYSSNYFFLISQSKISPLHELYCT